MENMFVVGSRSWSGLIFMRKEFKCLIVNRVSGWVYDVKCDMYVYAKVLCLCGLHGAFCDQIFG